MNTLYTTRFGATYAPLTFGNNSAKDPAEPDNTTTASEEDVASISAPAAAAPAIDPIKVFKDAMNAIYKKITAANSKLSSRFEVLSDKKPNPNTFTNLKDGSRTTERTSKVTIGTEEDCTFYEKFNKAQGQNERKDYDTKLTVPSVGTVEFKTADFAYKESDDSTKASFTDPTGKTVNYPIFKDPGNARFDNNFYNLILERFHKLVNFGGLQAGSETEVQTASGSGLAEAMSEVRQQELEEKERIRTGYYKRSDFR